MNNDKKDFYYWYEAAIVFFGTVVMAILIAIVAGTLVIMPAYRAIFEAYSSEISTRINELEIISKTKPLSIDQQIEFHRLMEIQLIHKKKNDEKLKIQI